MIRVSVSKKIDCVAILDVLFLSAPRKLLIKQIGRAVMRAVIMCHLNRGTA
jgi:hypothetical protein